MSQYPRADFAPLRETVYGIGVHWTTWTAPRSGAPKPFPKAVEEFDVSAFAARAAEAGAGHVLFTLTHALHWLPGPNPEVDRVLPGRSCERDLPMELADALAARGIKLMLYYNHATYSAGDFVQDPEWQRAVGSLEKDRGRYYDNYCSILSWMGERYGRKAIAWWFDSACEHARHADTPWRRFTQAAKVGHSERLVTYNSGITNFLSCTEYQDYWAGEVDGLAFRARGPATPTGFPWYSFVTWHGHDRYCQRPVWGIEAGSEKAEWMKWPPVEPEALRDYLRRFTVAGGAVTFNVPCYQDGSLYEPDLNALRGLRAMRRPAP